MLVLQAVHGRGLPEDAAGLCAVLPCHHVEQRLVVPDPGEHRHPQPSSRVAGWQQWRVRACGRVCAYRLMQARLHYPVLPSLRANLSTTACVTWCRKDPRGRATLCRVSTRTTKVSTTTTTPTHTHAHTPPPPSTHTCVHTNTQTHTCTRTRTRTRTHTTWHTPPWCRVLRIS